ERPSSQTASRALFLPTALASCEIGREDRGTTVAGERAERDSDAYPAEARPEQDGSMGRAGQPRTDDPLSADSRSPGEVFAEDGTACTLGHGAARDGAVREVLALHHVR